MNLDAFAFAVLIDTSVKVFCLRDVGFPELFFLWIRGACHKNVSFVENNLPGKEIFNKEG
jgi:hypothetical protein